MTENLSAIDPQEHVDAIYHAAEVLRLEAGFYFDLHATDSHISDPIEADDHARLVNAATNLESAAQALIDTHTERDAIRDAAVDLIETIDQHTDCMDNRIDREALDPWIDRLQQLVDEQTEDECARPRAPNEMYVVAPLSSSFLPALQKAMRALRKRLPLANDAELLGQILFGGIVAAVESTDKQASTEAMRL